MMPKGTRDQFDVSRIVCLVMCDAIGREEDVVMIYGLIPYVFILYSIPGEGSGILVLETLESAKLRNAQVIAEIVGYGMSGEWFVDCRVETT